MPKISTIDKDQKNNLSNNMDFDIDHIEEEDTNSTISTELEEEDSGFNSSEEDNLRINRMSPKNSSNQLNSTARSSYKFEEPARLKLNKIVDKKPFVGINNNWKTSNQIKASTFPRSVSNHNDGVIDPPLQIKLACYLCYAILIGFGYLRIFLEKFGIITNGMCTEKNRSGYTPIYNSWQPFFTEYIYRRVSDIFGQPIVGNPGGVVRILERKSDDFNRNFYMTGKSYDCINLASYDYLGFSNHTETDIIEDSIRNYGVGVGIMSELGYTDKHRMLEEMFAKFIGKESCIIFGMGYATNSNNIPALVTDSAGTLILADQHSHTSVRAGLFLSKATFKMFHHNDFDDLETKIRQAIAKGNQKTGQPWHKIIIIVEGVYSMEGTIVDLPRLVELKKRYKCYLYIDEAHSIGAIGSNGVGVCDYFGIDPDDIDLLMGTMTKSFAAAGGYIAGSKPLIDHIRANSGSNYAGSMAAPVAQQIINTLTILMDRTKNDGEGKARIDRLLSNTHYMRKQLKMLGFMIYGNHDSPVIPIMVYFPSKVGSIVRMGIRKGLALVAAGYPATTLETCRIRLCMSASHTKQTLDRAIAILSEMGDQHQIKYARNNC